MIIACPSCEKKFEVNSDLIPSAGRTMQCGSCGHMWFFKKDDQYQINNLNEKPIIKRKDNVEEKLYSYKRKNVSRNITNDKALIKYEEKTNFPFGKILRYILVLILTFITLILLLDTIKIPLSNFFPNIEFILFNLYETIKDITLFLKDLS